MAEINWTPARRLQSAREATGLEQRDVAALIGIGFPWYCDLEMHPNDVAMTLSLEELCHLGSVVRTDPLRLLIGDRASSVERTIQFGEIVQRLADRMAALALDVEQFGERVGWDLTKIMVDSEALWALNTDGFRDVSKAADVDWISAFPRSPRVSA
jgi:hypothetical protein